MKPTLYPSFPAWVLWPTAWREALQRLVDDPDLVARLRSNVRPPLTLEEHAEQIEKLYASLI
jgi:hypothetical protein